MHLVQVLILRALRGLPRRYPGCKTRAWLGLNFVYREKRILWVAFSRRTGRIVSLGTRGGRGVDFVNAQKLILWVDFCAPHRGPTVNARKLLMVFVNAAKLGFMNARKLLMPMTFARRK